MQDGLSRQDDETQGGIAPATPSRTARRQQSQRDLRLNFAIQDVARLQLRYVDALMKPHGVTRAQWLVATFLSRREGVTQTDLAAALDMSRVNLGTLLDKLDNAGFVTRVQHPVDGRAKCVFLTAKGNRLVEKVRDLQQTYAAAVLARLDDAERDQLLDLLGRIRTTIAGLNLGARDED